MQEADVLLQVRTAELKDAQEYLSTSDAVSYADVQRMVENLNSKIFQTAAQVTDEFLPKLARAVYKYSHEDNPILVQVLVQAYLVDRAAWVINAWSLPIDPAYQTILTEVHAKIFVAENQAVSARWRTLTKRHLTLLADGIDRYIPALCGVLFRGLLDILVTSGVPMAVGAIEEKARATFGDEFATIARQVLELQKVIGQDVTSSEFQVLCSKHDDQFLAEFMQDIDDGGARAKEDTRTREGLPIMCTTELGLQRRGKRAGVKGEKDVEERSVMLKAKVAMPSLVEDFKSQAKAGDQMH
ncbi:hypothetical protein BC835DRAFT_1281177 [Cytidiella melzeri]|nr:hypothetical protein BC835DRAFT_1281177 [Cytidiella melzeri]